MPVIAFFGVGTMGTPMAINLLKAGYNVQTKIYKDCVQGPETLQKYGEKIMDSVAEVVANADYILSIVPDDQAVREVYLNEEMLEHIRPGTIMIEMTSCSPEVMEEVQTYYAGKNVALVDCSVTGALQGAIEGNLGILASGDVDVIKKAQPIFDILGNKTSYLGKQGNAKRFKALNNLLAAINLTAASEIYRLAYAAQMDLEQVYNVLKISSGNSVQFERNFPRMIAQDFEPTFTVALLRKDMGLALDLAKGQHLALAELTLQLFQTAKPYDQEDCSAIVKVDRLF